MSNNSTQPHGFVASGRKKFNPNLRSHWKVRDRKQAHPDITEIDAQGIRLGRLSKYLHGGVQQLAMVTTPVFEVGLDRHP